MDNSDTSLLQFHIGYLVQLCVLVGSCLLGTQETHADLIPCLFQNFSILFSPASPSTPHALVKLRYASSGKLLYLDVQLSLVD